MDSRWQTTTGTYGEFTLPEVLRRSRGSAAAAVASPAKPDSSTHTWIETPEPELPPVADLEGECAIVAAISPLHNGAPPPYVFTEHVITNARVGHVPTWGPSNGLLKDLCSVYVCLPQHRDRPSPCKDFAARARHFPEDSTMYMLPQVFLNGSVAHALQEYVGRYETFYGCTPSLVTPWKNEVFHRERPDRASARLSASKYTPPCDWLLRCVHTGEMVARRGGKRVRICNPNLLRDADPSLPCVSYIPFHWLCMVSQPEYAMEVVGFHVASRRRVGLTITRMHTLASGAAEWSARVLVESETTPEGAPPSAALLANVPVTKTAAARVDVHIDGAAGAQAALIREFLAELDAP